MQGTWRARVGVIAMSVGVLLVGLAIRGPSADAAVNSLAGWVQEGAAAAGTWQVAGNGLSVEQTQNGAPTFFRAPSVMNSGSFTVDITPNSAGDDDYIGLVLGYLQPTLGSATTNPCNNANCINNYVLLDWKQADQTGGAQAGMTLMRVNGNFDIRNSVSELPCFWQHGDTADCDIIASDRGAGKGWTSQAINRLRVSYAPNHIKIEKINALNGTAATVFDLDGNFPGGFFGFYNYSQAQTVYSISDIVITSPAQAATTTAPTTNTTIAVGGATTTIAGAATTTTFRTGSTLRTTIVRTGNDTQATTLQLLGGVALIALGALFTAARGKRPEGRFFS